MDASNKKIDAVSQQHSNEMLQPFSFFSLKEGNLLLRKQEIVHRQKVTGSMLLSNTSDLSKGQNFRIIKDHKPLVFAFKKRRLNISKANLPATIYLGIYNEHPLCGTEKTVADVLSRIDTCDVN